ncbi:MAG: hypothetical protein R3E50_03040 [Halioglobus sp.]
MLLLSIQIGYFVTALPLLRGAGRRCISELHPLLDYANPELIPLIRRFEDMRLPGLGAAIIVGGVVTVVFQEAQFGRFSEWLAQPDSALGEIWTVLTAWTTWTLGLSAIALVITDAAAMRKLGRDWVAVDLLRTEQLACFSRYGLQLSGTVIGLMALWAVSLVLITPLVGIGFTERSGNIGVLLILIYMVLAVAVFIFPQLGIRERVRMEKDRVYEQLTQMLPNPSEAIAQANANPERLAGLLSARAQVRDVTEWPAGQDAQLRLAFYLMVPLLSWSAAALTEQLVSRMLSG